MFYILKQQNGHVWKAVIDKYIHDTIDSKHTFKFRHVTSLCNFDINKYKEWTPDEFKQHFDREASIEEMINLVHHIVGNLNDDGTIKICGEQHSREV